MATAAPADEAAILAMLDTVPDPEIPVLSITDLGIVRGVADNPPRVLVTPTYTGCPATIAIEMSIREALDKAGFDDVADRARDLPALDHRLDNRARPRSGSRPMDRSAGPVSDRRMPAMRIDRHRVKSAASARRHARRSGAANPAWSHSTASNATDEFSLLTAHHSAKLPSLVRKIGLRQRWRSLSASRTAASSISTPRPGPSGTGR